MFKTPTTTSKIVLGMGLLLGTITPSYAQDDACCNNLVTAVNNVETAVSDGFTEVVKLINDLTALVVDFSSQVTVNSGYSTALEWIPEDATNKTQQLTAQAFTMDRNQSRQQIDDYFTKVPYVSDRNAGDKVGNYVASSLMNQTSLSPEQLPQAEQFIQILSGAGHPIEPLDPKAFSGTATKPAAKLFQNTLGSYNALQSVGLNAFYKILAARTPDANLGPYLNKNAASPMELMEHMVTEPLSPSWMEEMIKANPADVEKQMLLILVGIQNISYMNYLQLEQLNATLGAIQLQQQQEVNRATLNQLRTDAQ